MKRGLCLSATPLRQQTATASCAKLAVAACAAAAAGGARGDAASWANGGSARGVATTAAARRAAEEEAKHGSSRRNALRLSRINSVISVKQKAWRKSGRGVTLELQNSNPSVDVVRVGKWRTAPPWRDEELCQARECFFFGLTVAANAWRLV